MDAEKPYLIEFEDHGGYIHFVVGGIKRIFHDLEKAEKWLLATG